MERRLPPPTTRPAGDCRNSYEEKCGPFFWDPPPEPNQPLTMEIAVYPHRPRVGDTVTFVVTVSDPDAPVYSQPHSVDFGNGQAITVTDSCAVAGDPPYGAWTPPDPFYGEGEDRYVTSYKEPGTYTVRFGPAVSGDEGPCNSGYANKNPYGNRGDEGSITFEVTT